MPEGDRELHLFDKKLGGRGSGKHTILDISVDNF